VPDFYTLDDNIEDLRLRLERFTKLYREGISPNDYESGSVFSTIDPNDKEKMEKNYKTFNERNNWKLVYKKTFPKELPRKQKNDA